MGRQTTINLKANKILKAIYLEKGITSCEIKRPGCWGNSALGFAHKSKRIAYYGNLEKLSDFNETILACNPCHMAVEGNRKLTEELFKKLR